MSDVIDPPMKDTPPPLESSGISVEAEMRHSYLDYAMSVIVSRALPDVCDGLKPVHRRILYSMHENGFEWNKPYRKSARVVGDVIGKYHPHGDKSIYDALVRMAQSFSMSLPLLDGQGNFGSVDGDPPAAMRYTEVRMAKPAHALLEDLERDTVDFQDNYDGSEREPVVLPARFPNILVNGAGGIAVGMATNIPPHNMGEVVRGCIAMIDTPDISQEELEKIIPGPDFPTGGIILGREGIVSAYRTGRGSFAMRGQVTIETSAKDKESIIITEIPYQVNKSALIEKIALLVRNNVINGISELRDESDRDGMRIVADLKRSALADVVLNQLYRHTALQSSFSANMVALNRGRPDLFSLQQFLTVFLGFREEVVIRRIKDDLKKDRARAHLLAGLAIAVDNVDTMVAIIRAAPNPAAARAGLMEKDWPAEQVAELIKLVDDPSHQISDKGSYKLSLIQAQAILDLRLQRLTALGREEIDEDVEKIAASISVSLKKLANRHLILADIKAELQDCEERFTTPRRTVIVDAQGDFEDEDLIEQADMVVTVSHTGYIKRVPLDTYRSQHRGGHGRAGMSTKADDFVQQVFVASTHDPILFFSSTGIFYKLKVWRLPQALPQARGKAMVNLFPLSQGERITTVMPLPSEEEISEDRYVVFATTSGYVRRNKLADFLNVNKNGKIAMKLPEGDTIVGVCTCTKDDDVLLTTQQGYATRFSVKDVRVFEGRSSRGVRGVRLGGEDKVVSITLLKQSDSTVAERGAYLKRVARVRREAGDDMEDLQATPNEATLSDARYAQLGAREEFILTISQRGFGKKTSSYAYRAQQRGGKGVRAMKIIEKNGPVMACFPVRENDQIILVTDKGKLIRCDVSEISFSGRITQGVAIVRTQENAQVMSVARLSDFGDQEELT